MVLRMRFDVRYAIFGVHQFITVNQRHAKATAVTRMIEALKRRMSFKDCPPEINKVRCPAAA